MSGRGSSAAGEGLGDSGQKRPNRDNPAWRGQGPRPNHSDATLANGCPRSRAVEDREQQPSARSCEDRAWDRYHPDPDRQMRRAPCRTGDQDEGVSPAAAPRRLNWGQRVRKSCTSAQRSRLRRRTARRAVRVVTPRRRVGPGARGLVAGGTHPVARRQTARITRPVADWPRAPARCPGDASAIAVGHGLRSIRHPSWGIRVQARQSKRPHRAPVTWMTADWGHEAWE